MIVADQYIVQYLSEITGQKLFLLLHILSYFLRLFFLPIIHCSQTFMQVQRVTFIYSQPLFISGYVQIDIASH